MSSPLLGGIVDDLQWVLEQSLPHLRAGRFDDDHVLGACRQWRRRGIGRFLMSARPSELWADLARSSSALAAHLTATGGRNVAASKCEPWFDAVVIGDWAGADVIARGASTVLLPDLEYEEDYLHVKLLQALTAGRQGKAALERMLVRQRELAVEGPAARTEVGQALVDADAGALSDALERLLGERALRYAEARAAEVVTEEEWATEAHVCIEGLAIVRLAERLGLQVEPGLQFIPDLLRAAPLPATSPQAWLN